MANDAMTRTLPLTQMHTALVTCPPWANMVEAGNGAEVLYDDGEPKAATDHATVYLMKIPMGRAVPRPTQPPATVTMDPQLAQVTMAGVHYGTWTPDNAANFYGNLTRERASSGLEYPALAG